MKNVLFASAALVASSLVFFGCSSGPPPDPGVAKPTPAAGSCAATEQNPYQACYPTDDIGTQARTGPSGIAGNRIANFAFTGYPWTDVTKQVTTGSTSTVRLADYFDPKGQIQINGITGIKIIHITVAAVWCGPCNEETDYIAGNQTNTPAAPNPGFAAELAPSGVVFLQALSDGPLVGHGATLTNLNDWINYHTSDFTSMLDPGVANLGVFFDAAAVPFNANIDARSMEILSTEVGFNTAMDTDIKSWLNWQNSHPAK